RMDDVVVGGEGVAVDSRVEGRTGERFLASEFLFGSNGVPTDGGTNLLKAGDRNFNMFVDRIRPGPVKAGTEPCLFPLADGTAEAEDNGSFLLLDGEEAGGEEHDNQQPHDDFDDSKTAAKGFGKRLRPGIDGSVGRRWGLCMEIRRHSHYLCNKLVEAP